MWVFTTLLVAVSAMYFPLDYRTERCFGLLLPPNHPFSGAYLVSGQGENNVMTRVESPTKRVMYHGAPKTHEGKFELTSAEEGRYRFCFKAFDRWPKNVSFDYKAVKKEETADLPSEEEITPLRQDVQKMKQAFDAVARNVQFTKQQERTHRDLTERTCDRVLWCAILKIAVLSLVSFLQISVLKRVGETGGQKV